MTGRNWWFSKCGTGGFYITVDNVILSKYGSITEIHANEAAGESVIKVLSFIVNSQIVQHFLFRLLFLILAKPKL